MDGHISVTSTEGVGSTFRVSLPVELDPESPGPEAPPIKLPPLRVLAVDDHAVNRLVLTEQLSLWGLTCVAVPDGPSGIDALRAARASGQPYDMVIIDTPPSTGLGLKL